MALTRRRADNASSDNTPITAAPDLEIVKSDGGASVAPGGPVRLHPDLHQHRKSRRQQGDDHRDGAVAQQLQPRRKYAGRICAPNSNAGSTCTFAVGIVAGGGAGGSVTFAVTVNSPLPAGITQIANTAAIGDDASNGIDTAPANNSSSDTTPVRAAPDLRLSKRANVLNAVPDAPIVYTLTYTNVGSIAATGVVITRLCRFRPASMRRPACRPSGTVRMARVGGTTCTTGVRGAVAGGGGSGALRFTVKVNSAPASGTTQITNRAVIGDDGTNGADLTPNNNVAYAVILFNPTAVTLISFSATAEGTIGAGP